MEIGKLFESLKNGKKPDKTSWLLLGLLGLLLLVIAIPTGSSKKDSKQEETKKTADETNAAQDTTETKMEEKLEMVLSNIDGVGKVRVLITYKDNGTQVVEKDGGSSNSSTTEEDASGGTRKVTQQEKDETTVYATGGDGEPFITKELSPEIEGILVVAEGGDKISVRQNISNAILALFPVEAHKIVVVKMSN